MFIELVDALRCPGAHEETWLVAAVERYHGRYIAEGALGCPVCRAEYRVRDGAVHFTDPAAPMGSPPGVLAPEDVLRAQALLDLSEPGGRVVLAGHAAALADALEDAASVATLLVNPVGHSARPGHSTLWCGAVVPLAAGSLRGVLLGAGVSSAVVPSLVRALRPNGRLVAPVHLPVPMDMVELARDDREWVASRVASTTSAPVGLRRRQGEPGA
ncbi:MAG: hypothetical protein JNJ98_03140 [Gemmatimonadetes bacterium]|nr:hypothetical protein [Gemmatimonadota bacterium]